jgi:hypothetical protein
MPAPRKLSTNIRLINALNSAQRAIESNSAKLTALTGALDKGGLEKLSEMLMGLPGVIALELEKALGGIAKPLVKLDAIPTSPSSIVVTANGNGHLSSEIPTRWPYPIIPPGFESVMVKPFLLPKPWSTQRLPKDKKQRGLQRHVMHALDCLKPENRIGATVRALILAAVQREEGQMGPEIVIPVDNLDHAITRTGKDDLTVFDKENPDWNYQPITITEKGYRLIKATENQLTWTEK